MAVGRRLYQVAFRIVRDRDAAEDAMQRALVDLWRDLPRLRDIDRFDAWIHRIVVRAAYDEIRQRKRHAHVREIHGTEPSTPDASSAVSVQDALARAFDALSPDHRAVVVLHHYAGFPLRDIADILDVPYGTVGSRLHYALRHMRAAMGGSAEPTGGVRVAHEEVAP